MLSHRAAVLVREQDLLALPNILEKISPARAHEMRRQGQFFWNKYFKSMKEITLTTLQVINDRVFPYTAKDEAWWNEPIPRVSKYGHGSFRITDQYPKLVLQYKHN